MKYLVSACLLTTALGVLTLAACSSDDKTTTPTGTSSSSSSGAASSSSSGAAGTCSITEASKVTTVEKKAGADAKCPTLTAAQLNEEDDSGTEGCNPKLDTTACTASLNCSETDPDGTKTTTTGTFAKDGAGLKGSVTVVVAATGEPELTCAYDMTIQ